MIFQRHKNFQFIFRCATNKNKVPTDAWFLIAYTLVIRVYGYWVGSIVLNGELEAQIWTLQILVVQLT